MKQILAWVGNLITTEIPKVVKVLHFSFKRKSISNMNTVLPITRCNQTECYYVFRFYEPKSSQRKPLMLHGCSFTAQEMSSHFSFI